MDGIVLPVGEQIGAEVEAIWAELAQAFDLHLEPALPHVSLHVAHGYDAAALYPLLAALAHNTAPLSIQTTGLGLFTVPEPVLYVTVTCGRDLLNLHDTFWQQIEPTSRGSVPYYQPGTWVPHITLAHGLRLQACLPDVIRLLGGRAYNWSFPVTEVAHLDNPLTTHERWSFEG